VVVEPLLTQAVLVVLLLVELLITLVVTVAVAVVIMLVLEVLFGHLLLEPLELAETHHIAT
jgi:hypothetical protein